MSRSSPLLSLVTEPPLQFRTEIKDGHLWSGADPAVKDIKDPVLPIMHCAPAFIGGHFLDVEKPES